MDLNQAKEAVAKCLIAINSGTDVKAAEEALERFEATPGYGMALLWCIGLLIDQPPFTSLRPGADEPAD